MMKKVQFNTNITGCSHYQRKCDVWAKCCKRYFPCRKCHDEEMDSPNRPMELQHTIDRKEIKKIKCRYCACEQVPRASCKECGVSFARYCCLVCNLYDDDPKKKIYHCDDCGVCLVGSRKNSAHCKTCDYCMSREDFSTHECFKDVLKRPCPVCLDSLQDSTELVRVLPCGHPIHVRCQLEMIRKRMYCCPICSKSMIDDTERTSLLRIAIAILPMPKEYHGACVWILCNECCKKSYVNYHFHGHECLTCNSFNTTRIRDPNPSSVNPSSVKKNTKSD
ncbi:MAG: RING finger and CHY zinc finger domain-containing protein [Promethearchaeota archaeon]